MSQLAVREQGWDSVISEEMHARRAFDRRRATACIPSTKGISTLVKGIDRPGEPCLYRLIGLTSNLQRTASIASTRRTHVVSVVAVVAAQQVLALHLALQTRDVPVAEVLAQLLHLLQLQQMDTQHLYRFDHLQCP